MYLPVVMAASASVPWFATYLAESDASGRDDLLAAAYLCGIGLLISLAAILDDAHALTAWFGIATEPSAFGAI